MTTKTKIIISVVALVIAYGFGRFSTPTKVKTIVQTVEVDKKHEDQNQSDKEHTVTHTITNKDGTTETTTTTDVDKETKTSDTEEKDTTTTKEKIVERDSSKVTVLAVAGINVIKPSTPDYGLSVSKPVLGPVTIGVFGFQSGTIGAGVGLSF